MRPDCLQPASKRILFWINRGLLILVLLFPLLSPSPIEAAPAVINIPLQGDMVQGGSVWRFKAAPLAGRVVFLGDLETDEKPELYSAPARRGARTKISGAAGSVDEVHDYQIAPNDQRVVFTTEPIQTGYGQKHLWSVPTDGSQPPVPLNQELDENQSIYRYAISPDSAYVIYYTIRRAGGSHPNEVELFSIPIGGGSAIGGRKKLNCTQEIAADFTDVATASTSRGIWVVYSGVMQDMETHFFYSTPVTGGACVPLNTGYINAFRIAPKGDRVVYAVHLTASDSYHIHSVSIFGPAEPAVELTPDLTFEMIYALEITADSRRVVYTALEKNEAVNHLYSIPLNGGPATARLEPPASTGYCGSALHFEMTSNGAAVVFTSLVAEDQLALYAALADGTAWRLLSDSFVYGFTIAPNNQGVVFQRSDLDHIIRLYSITLDGTHLTELAVTSRDYAVTPNSRYLVYITNPDENGVRNLRSTSITGSPAGWVQWNTPFKQPAGTVLLFELLPGSSSLLYTADTEVDGQFMLYYAFAGYTFYVPNVVRDP